MTTSTKRNPRPEPEQIEQVVGINVLLPAELHRRFRSRAILDGLNLTEATVAAFEQYLAR